MRTLCLSMLWGLAVLGVAAPGAAFPAGQPGPLATIRSLDVPRYTGRWYEVAKYPNRFQQQCLSDTTADYRLQPDGALQVVNRCRLQDGRFDEAVGAARQIGEPSSPKLKVRFAPAWLGFIPAVWGDYWVIDLDAGYQLVAVSEPKREYLWILSRTPKLAPDDYAPLLQRLRAQGFDLQKLEWTRHTAID